MTITVRFYAKDKSVLSFNSETWPSYAIGQELWIEKSNYSSFGFGAETGQKVISRIVHHIHEENDMGKISHSAIMEVHLEAA